MRLARRTAQRGIVANMTASTVAQYPTALPADRRAAFSAVRQATNEDLPGERAPKSPR